MIHLKLQRRPLPWHAIICTVILVLFSILWSAQAAFAADADNMTDDAAELVGQIEVMPDGRLIGAWQVDDFAFIATRITVFRTGNGNFVVGRCVEVEYVTVGERTVAIKIATKRVDDCSA